MFNPVDYTPKIIQIEGGVQYKNEFGTFTFKEVELQKLDYTPNVDKWNCMSLSTLEDQTTTMKQKFSEVALETDPRTSDIWKDISSQVDKTIGEFMDGIMTEDELASQFQSLAQELFKRTAEEGYPIPIVASCQEQACTEAFYDEFRKRILDIAVYRNSEQGKQYITGEMNPNRTWKYYNSDYYYKSETAISAITRGMDDFVQNRGWAYTVPDYKGKGLNLYYNFNSAFSNRFCLDEQYLINVDDVPPKNFEWFYQSGGNRSAWGVVESVTNINPDGTYTTTDLINRNKFDPYDPYTASTWAAYTDETGKRHVVSQDIIFKDDISDLMNVASLLKFPKEERCEEVDLFLKNLQLFPKGYYRYMAVLSGLDYIV